MLLLPFFDFSIDKEALSKESKCLGGRIVAIMDGFMLLFHLCAGIYAHFSTCQKVVTTFKVDANSFLLSNVDIGLSLEQQRLVENLVGRGYSISTHYL